jgi:hypothetical protein
MAKKVKRTARQIEAEMRRASKVSDELLAVIDGDVTDGDEAHVAIEQVVSKLAMAHFPVGDSNPTDRRNRTPLVSHLTDEVMDLFEQQDDYDRSDLEALVMAIATKLVRGYYQVNADGVVSISAEALREAAA